MECKLEKNIQISISMCDNTKCLSVPAIFSLFMDLAGEHAQLLGCGADKLAEKGMFWLTAKTKIHINDRPLMMEKITAETWPLAPGRIRCDRCYAIKSGEEILAEGRTEWAIIEIATGRLCKAGDAYDGITEYCADASCPEPFEKLPEDFETAECIGTYRVASTDIDIGQHMNNAAYIKAMLGMLSCKETEELNISDMEIVFKTPCYEREELRVMQRKDGKYTDLAMIKPDGKAAAIARITSR